MINLWYDEAVHFRPTLNKMGVLVDFSGHDRMFGNHDGWRAIVEDGVAKVHVDLLVPSSSMWSDTPEGQEALRRLETLRPVAAEIAATREWKLTTSALREVFAQAGQTLPTWLQ